MELKITEVRKATSIEWDKIWRECDFATYYHSREWAVIWQKYTQGRLIPEALHIMFSDGNSVLLPFSSRRILMGFARQYVLSPAGTYGGWLSLDELSASHGRLLSEYIVNHLKNVTWRLNPYTPFETNLNVKGIKNDETHTLDLDCGFEGVYKRWSRGAASSVRKARRVGVEIREAITFQDWKDYYEVYEDSLKRWGESASSKYDWSLFENMYNLSSPDVKLWLAFFEGQVVAGALCLYAKKHVGYWHGAALSQYFKLRSVNLLVYEMIKQSCGDGYKWFDFNPSGGHEGVRVFKERCGALPKKTPVVHVVPCAIKVITDMAKMGRGIVRKAKRWEYDQN